MNNDKTLEEELARWDGVVDSLSVIYQQHRDDAQFMTRLVSLLDGPALQLPASWLLKRSLEEGRELENTDLNRLLEACSSLDNWQARLHLLQSLQYLAISSSAAPRLHSFLTTAVEDDNKFIRAWAYQGFLGLAEQHQVYGEEADALLDRAMREEAPAIKARLRHHLKQHDRGH